MIAKVKLTHTVTVFVKGENENQIMDWARYTTPSEAYANASSVDPEEHYDEIIECFVREDSDCDFDLTK